MRCGCVRNTSFAHCGGRCALPPLLQQSPYFGGERACRAAGADSEFDPSELLCGGCAPHSADAVCAKHGTDYIEFKCRFCCSIAVWLGPVSLSFRWSGFPLVSFVRACRECCRRWGRGRCFSASAPHTSAMSATTSPGECRACSRTISCPSAPRARWVRP